MRRGLIVVKDITNKVTGKPFKVKYYILPKEAYMGKVPKVYSYIKTWSCKVIAYITRASLPGRQDKLMPTKREGIFMEYDKNTIAYYIIYALNIYTTILLSNVRFFENIPGSTINNFQLWIEISSNIFEKLKGIYSWSLVRNWRGRLKGWRKNGSYLT